MLYVLEDDGRTPRATQDVVEWGRCLDGPHQQVAEDIVGEARVSTVFLGVETSGMTPPLLFETMVFGGALGGEQSRYATYEEAVAGHARVLARLFALVGARGSDAT